MFTRNVATYAEQKVHKMHCSRCKHIVFMRDQAYRTFRRAGVPRENIRYLSVGTMPGTTTATCRCLGRSQWGSGKCSCRLS
jgi:hypothetical protein